MGSLYDYTVAEIALHLQERAFGPEHTIDIGEDSWQLEHPLRCRLMQYDEAFHTMRTLRDTCAMNHALESGLADALRERRGVGRYQVGDDKFNSLLDLLEGDASTKWYRHPEPAKALREFGYSTDEMGVILDDEEGD